VCTYKYIISRISLAIENVSNNLTTAVSSHGSVDQVFEKPDLAVALEGLNPGSDALQYRPSSIGMCAHCQRINRQVSVLRKIRVSNKMSGLCMQIYQSAYV